MLSIFPLVVVALSPIRGGIAHFASRRALLLSPLAAVPLTLASEPAAAANPVREGMAAFAANKVAEAIELYDSVLAQNPGYKPYLWQRGLALYYADRFTDGAEQFAADVAVNPNDTEEQIWHLLCLAQVKKGGLEEARASKLTVGTDRRPVMRAAQQLFLSGSEADERALAGIATDGDTSSRFYAALYLSLYAESNGNTADAERRMREAVRTAYAQGGGRSDPMVELAIVAMKRRGWEGAKAEL
jgi:tetratricopeptide (TPR) repeat protein